MVWTSHETASSWGVTDNEIVFRGLKNGSMLKTRPVGVLVEQGGGNVGEMGWRPLSGGIAALWAQTIGVIASSDIENGYSLKTRLVEAVVEWGGIDVGGMGGRGESAIVGQHGSTEGSDC
ncbi:uncharacterized protein ARMOST_01347 [Armillaria ostoyae]|uniref:Uncharacterized protein n=1 Tax=Armillaria ostoyae TaxID=47428 RepID=A0A284QNW3_ARMOS|nr:uncharacterized protein ARMOST_01347 [Armillaria ostoyae]